MRHGLGHGIERLSVGQLGYGFSAAGDSKVVVPDSTGFKFKDIKLVKTTPVRDQNQSGTCWCFSTNTFLRMR